MVPVAALTLREVRRRSELPLALLPAIFAAHQFLEIAVWAGLDGKVSQEVAQLAMAAYLFIAWPLLPSYVPLAVLMIEPAHARRRVMPFLALGVVVSVYLAFVVLANPAEVIRHPHGLEYVTVVQHPIVWAVLYVVAVIGAPLMSGYRSIVAFGALNLVGLLLVAVAYYQAFASLWCAFAAVCSLLILLHLVQQRKKDPAPANATSGSREHAQTQP